MTTQSIINQRIAEGFKGRLYGLKFGMYIDIGAKRNTFRQKIVVAKKQRTITIGHYPEISLSAAIERAANNYYSKRGFAEQQSITVADLGIQWFQLKHRKAVISKTYDTDFRRFQIHILPALGKIPVQSLNIHHVTDLLEGLIAADKSPTADRVLTQLKAILAYGVAKAYIKENIALGVRDVLVIRKSKGHHKAITDRTLAKQLVKNTVVFDMPLVVKVALLTFAVEFARPKDLLSMRWSDIDMDSQTWTFQPSKIKTDGKNRKTLQENHIPDELFDLMLCIHQPGNDWVFPAFRGDNHVSDTTVRNWLNKVPLGDQHSLHGFRAMARTLIDEELEINEKIIEAHLSHVVKDINGSAYNRTEFNAQRRHLVEAWTDWLEIDWSKIWKN